VEKSTGRAERVYRLTPDSFLSHGNCIIREHHRIVGETFLPDIAANDTHEFSIGDDVDIVYKEDVTLISSSKDNESIYDKKPEPGIRSVYKVDIWLQSFKDVRPVKVEFTQKIFGRSVKLLRANNDMRQDGAILKFNTTLPADQGQLVSYDVEIIE